MAKIFTKVAIFGAHLYLAAETLNVLSLYELSCRIGDSTVLYDIVT